MTNIKVCALSPRAFRSALAALLLFFTGALFQAQETDDFEAALFGNADTGSGATDGNGAVLSDSGTVADPSGSFDAGSVSIDIAKTEYLVGGTVAVQANATIMEDAESYVATSDTSGRIFAKVSVPDYGALYIAYNAAHTFFQGYAGEGIAPPALDSTTPRYGLAELHYSFDISKKVFVRIGNQLISWGPSRIWTPVDFINLKKSDSFAALDSRSGKSGLRIHVPLRSSNVFAFADFSKMTSGGTYGDPAETVNLGGRFDFTARDFEFGVTAYGGANTQTQLGLDFSGRFIGSTIYGEFAFSPENKDNDQAVQTALGFSRPLDELKNWTISAEGFYNSRGRDLSGYTAMTINTLSVTERTPLYQGTWYFYSSLTANKFLSPSLSTTLSGIANLEDESYSIKIAESFSFPRSLPFTFSLSYAGGGKNKEFTRYSGTGAVSASLSARLEF